MNSYVFSLQFQKFMLSILLRKIKILLKIFTDEAYQDWKFDWLLPNAKINCTVAPI